VRNISGNFVLKNTPIYRMITSLNESGNTTKKVLYFTVATQADLFYGEELKAIDNLELHIHISRESVE
jgi:NAD(P)H-flavin reductase